MAEESTDPPVTPEKNNESNSKKMGKISIENPVSPNARRYSGEKQDSSNVIPHYLRASTGSCHDICKFGRRHAFEETSRRSLRIRTAKSSQNQLNSVEIIVSVKQKKENVVKNKPSADTRKCSVLVKPYDTKPYSPKLKASLDAKTYSPRQNAASRNKARLPNSPKESLKSNPPEIIKREILSPSRKVEVRSSIDNKMSRMDKKTYDQSVKRSSSVMPKPAKVRSSSVSDNFSDGIHGKGRRNSDVQTGRNMSKSAMSAKKELVPPAAPLSPKFCLSRTTSGKARKPGTLKLLSPLKGRSRVHNVETETSNGEDSEKILHVVENGIENGALESILNDHVIPAVPSPSSTNFLSDAKPRSSISHEKNGEEVKESGNEADGSVSDNSVSIEIAKVQLAKENHDENSRMGTEKNALEAILDDHTIPSFPSHEVDDEKQIKYSGNEADDYVTDEGMVHLVKENLDKSLKMGTEKDELEAIPDDHAIALPSSSSSSKSLSLSSSPSLLSHEEIKYSGNEEGEVISDKPISTEIRKAQAVKKNHKKTMRKSRVVPTEDKYQSPVKLKFRSGRVVDLQPDSNIPRRLKFRRAGVGGNKPDDFVSDNNKSTEISNLQGVKENHDKTLRKSKLVIFEDRYHSPHSPVKLLRSGKVVDHQSDNNFPRRLRFNRARVRDSEDGKGNLRRRTLKRVGSKDDASGSGLSSQNVVLKHQNVQGKKDAQGLFNNVIEETASKLVESRKSKVKALVGAFETVISLQERKPSLRIIS